MLHEITESLFDLQVAQHQHDERYHRDIAALSLHPRLVHMALHFAKYAGKLAGTPCDTTSVFTDAMLIALSSANVLNVKLAEHLPTPRFACVTLEHLGNDYARSRFNMSSASVARYAAVAAGRIADGCEKIDHLEDGISFRSHILTGLGDFTALALGYFATHRIDVIKAVRERHRQIAMRAPCVVAA